MSDKSWKTVGSKVVLDHPRLQLIEDDIILPDGTKTKYLKFAKKEAVTAICIKDGKVLLQKELSYPTGRELLQFPGGAIESGEDPKTAIKRELVEEAGLAANKLTRLGWFYVDNRRSASKLYVYLAEELAEVSKAGGDLEEDISDHWLEIYKVEELIRTNEIVNYSVLAAWSFFRSAKNSR